MTRRFLFSASGTSKPVIATTDISMCFSGLWVTYSAKAVRNISQELILSADFLKQNSVNSVLKNATRQQCVRWS